MKQIGVYKIINTVNGKVYVGSSKDINSRLSSHKRDLKNQKHHSFKLQFAVNKYGLDKFIFEVIEECEKEVLISREQYWIDLLEAYTKGYNCCKKAFCPPPHTKETRKKISLKRKGQRNSIATEFKKGIIPWSKGKKGIHISVKTEFKKGMIGAWSGKKRPPFSIEWKMKTSTPVIIDGVEFYSIREASRKLGIASSVVTYRLRNKNYQNYQFKNDKK